MRIETDYRLKDWGIEAAVLGAILLEKDAFVRVYSLLSEECFHYNENKFIYRRLKWMFDKNIQIDLLTVLHFAKTKSPEECEKFEIRGWEQITPDSFAWYLSELTMHVCSSAHIETHALILRELWAARELAAIQATAGADTSLENAKAVRDKLDGIFNISKSDDWLSLEEVITSKLIPRMDKAKTGEAASFKTGFRMLDSLSRIDGGDFVVIGARPSAGKTAFAMQLAMNIAKSGAAVGIISLETISERLAGRIISASSVIEYWKIWKNRLSESEYQQFYQTTDKMIDLPLFISDKPSATALDIRIAANKLKMRNRDKNMVIIIDYLQLVTPEKSKQANRQREIGEISRAMRLLTLELENTAVIALCQLNRESEKDGKPKASHLRESGDIEQDADKIWLLHRDRDNEEDLREKQGQYDNYDAELIVAKNKEGWTGTVPMLFSPERMVFKDRQYLFKPTGYNTERYQDDNVF